MDSFYSSKDTRLVVSEKLEHALEEWPGSMVIETEGRLGLLRPDGTKMFIEEGTGGIRIPLAQYGV